MRIGLDIGSTTIKAVVFHDGKIRYKGYRRHYSRIEESLMTLLKDMEESLPGMGEAAIAISGSAGMGLAEACQLPFVQEVHATRTSILRHMPQVDVAIELGGEDAKILFFGKKPDARMNGSCAGGTGAFIDQMATLLKLTTEELNDRAKEKEKIYPIASRCGVFAKSDAQPLLNQGAKVEDVAASILYAVVNQTISGLAQGRKIAGNVLYLGGPLTFLSELRSAFDHVLGIRGQLPPDSLYFVAMGAALLAEEAYTLADMKQRIADGKPPKSESHENPLFQSQAEYDAFLARHNRAKVTKMDPHSYMGRGHLGIDAGSTTVKTALISENGELLDTTYHANNGNPVPIIKEDLVRLYREYPNITLASVTVTGYGEALIQEAFSLDYGLVETMAHYMAARQFAPDVDFIIDIGGQDMKCFQITDGVVSDIFLNEACSSGCGSFLSTFSEALGQDIESFSKLGLFADAPVNLGSRCTVFMNSSVKQAQKDGASMENVSAGLSISVVKNAIYKVIRATNPAQLGKKVVVQGGTFYNDAVLRAFENEMGMDVVRPDIAGLMGAYGAALYGRERAVNNKTSTVLNEGELLRFTHESKATSCNLCTNRCPLTINTFNGGRRFISGNRCERPITGREAEKDGLDLYEYKQDCLAAYQPVVGARNRTIGLPLVLNLYETLPFWHTLFTELGFTVQVSPPSTRKLYYKGQDTIPSDTVCYPAKMAHGHIQALVEMGVDAVFYPCMTYNIDEELGDDHFNCPVVAYYPEVIKANCPNLCETQYLNPYLGMHRKKAMRKGLHPIVNQIYDGITKKELAGAVDKAYAAYDAYLADVRQKGMEIMEKARAAGKPIIVLAGRPYHVDQEINHGINKLITGHGAAVITEDSISHLVGKKHTN
ncbi:acyl-CoA dehydratase activase, partial [Eubacteriales bacterium OttesenSCG-928-M02]|nr:acyl-CoA dehydratase activase [Eubacteriales bacterium OttesenSCG-928-M02]